MDLPGICYIILDFHQLFGEEVAATAPKLVVPDVKSKPCLGTERDNHEKQFIYHLCGGCDGD